MKIKDSKAIRLYGPYEGWGQHWIAQTPEGEVENFKDPLDLALWLDERAGKLATEDAADAFEGE